MRSKKGNNSKTNNVIKSNKKVFIRLGVIAAIILVYFLLYIIEPNLFNLSFFKENNNPKQTINKVEELDVNSEQIKALYDKVRVPMLDVYEDLHKSTKVYNSGLTEDYKIFLTFLRFNDGYESCDETGLKVNKEEFINKYKELFGDSNIKILKDGFSYELNISNVKETENEYIFYSAACYGGGALTVYKIIGAEKDLNNNMIYIYDNYLYQQAGQDSKGRVPVYADSDRKEKLLDDIGDYYEEYRAKKEKGLVAEVLFKYYKEYTGKDLPKYKHIFAQSPNGEYYWVSSEKVNS